MLDDMDIQYRVLEFEYKDYLSKREVTHYAEWGVPMGWFAALLASGQVKGLVYLSLVGFIALLLYLAIKSKREEQDLNLEAIRILLTDLRRQERLPQSLVEAAARRPTPLSTTQNFLLLIILILFFGSIYLQGGGGGNPKTGLLEVAVVLTIAALGYLTTILRQ